MAPKGTCPKRNLKWTKPFNQPMPSLAEENPAELLDALSAAGGRIEFVNGVARLRGKPPAPELAERLRANREAVMHLALAREQADRDRYLRPPPAEYRLDAATPLPDATVQRHVLAYVLRQFMRERASSNGRSPLCVWLMQRTQDYHDAGVHPHAGEFRASLDVLCWQTGKPASEALQWLAGLDECFKTNPKTTDTLAQIHQRIGIKSADED